MWSPVCELGEETQSQELADEEIFVALQSLIDKYQKLKLDNKQKDMEIKRLKKLNQELRFKADVYYARWQTNFEKE